MFLWLRRAIPVLTTHVYGTRENLPPTTLLAKHSAPC